MHKKISSRTVYTSIKNTISKASCVPVYFPAEGFQRLIVSACAFMKMFGVVCLRAGLDGFQCHCCPVLRLLQWPEHKEQDSITDTDHANAQIPTQKF